MSCWVEVLPNSLCSKLWAKEWSMTYLMLLNKNYMTIRTVGYLPSKVDNLLEYSYDVMLEQ
jgi:hypothetical protein